MKKIISTILCLIIILASAVGVSAAISTNYSVSADYSTVQGNNGWHYMYRDGGNYSSYVELEYMADGNRWVRINQTTGNVMNFATSATLQARGSSIDNKTAYIWQAPYSGKVTLSAVSNIRMSYKGQKAPIEVGIAHTNANNEVIDYDNEYDNDTNTANNDYIWHGVIAASDIVGIDPYSIDIEVSIGDKIYFEMASIDASSATIVWQPMITYKQAAEYKAEGVKIDSLKGLAENSVVSCEVNTGSALNAYIHFLVFDNNGRLRVVKAVTDSEITGNTISTSVTLPSFDTKENETSYEGWRISLFAITKSTDRFYPISISEKLELN